jgi:hypothetical protein
MSEMGLILSLSQFFYLLVSVGSISLEPCPVDMVKGRFGDSFQTLSQR